MVEEARRAAEEAKAACVEVRPAREAAACEKLELDAAQAALWARFDGIVDLTKIERLRREMLDAWRQQKAHSRERFKPLQEPMREFRDVLHAVGVTSRAIRLAVAANFNQPDWDRADLTLPIKLDVHVEDE